MTTTITIVSFEVQKLIQPRTTMKQETPKHGYFQEDTETDSSYAKRRNTHKSSRCGSENLVPTVRCAAFLTKHIDVYVCKL